jgi:hypothetical protein
LRLLVVVAAEVVRQGQLVAVAVAVLVQLFWARCICQQTQQSQLAVAVLVTELVEAVCKALIQALAMPFQLLLVAAVKATALQAQ